MYQTTVFDMDKIRQPEVITDDELSYELLTATFWYHHGYCAPGDEQVLEIAGRRFVKKVCRYQRHPKGRAKWETEITDGKLMFEPGRRRRGGRMPSYHWKMA